MKIIDQKTWEDRSGIWDRDFVAYVERLMNAVEGRMAKGVSLGVAADAAVSEIKAPACFRYHIYSSPVTLDVLADAWEHGKAFRSHAQAQNR